MIALVGHVAPTAAQLADPAAAKAAGKCQQAIVKSGAAFAAATAKSLEACFDGVLTCVQTKPADAKCLAKAVARCGQEGGVKRELRDAPAGVRRRGGTAVRRAAVRRVARRSRSVGGERFLPVPSPTPRPTPAANLAFVSSALYATTLGSATAYDTQCNELATAAGINSDTDDAFIAWMSDAASNAVTRLGAARGFVRVDGAPIADTVADLAAGKLFPVLLDENGQTLFSDEAPMTGTQFSMAAVKTRTASTAFRRPRP